MKKRTYVSLAMTAFLISIYFMMKRDISVEAISIGHANPELKKISKSNLKIKNELTTAKSVPSYENPTGNEDQNNLRVEGNDYSEVYLQTKSLYCLLRKSSASIPMSGDVRISYALLGDHGKEGSYAIVSSPSCPKDTYSMVKFNANHLIEKQIDCRNTNLVELSLELQRQWGILENKSNDNQLNVALAGPGYIPVFCPNKGYKLTRSGKFKFDSSGTLLDGENCVVWSMPNLENPSGGPFTAEDADLYFRNGFDEAGCLANGRCLGAIDPLGQDVSKMKFKDSASMWAELDLRKINPIPVTKVYMDSLEDLDNPLRSPTGWEHADFWVPMSNKIDCEEVPLNL